MRFEDNSLFHISLFIRETFHHHPMNNKALMQALNDNRDEKAVIRKSVA